MFTQHDPETSGSAMPEPPSNLSHLPEAESIRRMENLHRPQDSEPILYRYLLKRSFKHETFDNVTTFLRRGDYMITLDIQDGFYHIPIHPRHQHLLAFQIPGTSVTWNFCSMPFGLSVAPWAFHQLMSPIMTHIRSKVTPRNNCYVDDVLFAFKNRTEAKEKMPQILKTLKDLGLHVNMKKSSLKPEQMKEYLGFKINSNAWTITLPTPKMRALKRDISRVLTQNIWEVPPKILLSIAGRMVATFRAVF